MPSNTKPSAAEMAAKSRVYLGRSYKEMDCQQFVENALALVGIEKDLPGSNAWYRAMEWVGTPEECKRKFGTIPAGAFLFILEQDGGEPAKYKADGIGNASHMGIVTNTGEGAIHSSSSRGGVYESKFQGKTIPNGGWNQVGLWSGLYYGFALLDEKNQMIEVDVLMRKAIVAGNGGGVNFRSAPDTKDNHYMGRIADGEEVTVTAIEGDWASIIYRGTKGFAMVKFLDLQGVDDSEFLQINLERGTAETLYAALGNALNGGGVG